MVTIASHSETMTDTDPVASSKEFDRTTAFFPQILPDELIVSVISRYSFLTQRDRKGTNEALFAQARKNVAYDLPLGIVRLAEAAGSVDPKRLIMEHTLYPFFVALFDERKRDDVMSSMLSDSKVHNKVLGRVSLVPRPEFLRHCEFCDIVLERNFGTKYWQRKHQLPTNLVCVQHRVPLRASSVTTSPGGNKYHPLTSAISGGPPLLPPMNNSSIERFVHLARLGEELLKWGGRARPEFPISLRKLALDVGFRSSLGHDKVDMITLSREFHEDSLDLLALWPWLDKRVVNKANPLWISTHTARDRPLSTVAFTYAVLRSYLELKSQRYAFPTEERDWSDVHIDRSSIARKQQLESLTKTSLESLISEATNQIVAEVPLVRVSTVEIGRRAPEIAHAWRINLDGTFRSMLKERCETVDEFHLRIVRFAVAEAAKEDRRVTLTALRRSIGNRTSEELRKLRTEAEKLESRR